MPVWLNCRGHSRPMCAPQIGNGFTSSVSENAPLFGNRLSSRGFVTSSHVGRGGISLFQSLAHQIPSPTACLDLGPWSCYGGRVWIHLTFCFHLFITLSTRHFPQESSYLHYRRSRVWTFGLGSNSVGTHSNLTCQPPVEEQSRNDKTDLQTAADPPSHMRLLHPYVLPARPGLLAASDLRT